MRELRKQFLQLLERLVCSRKTTSLILSLSQLTGRTVAKALGCLSRIEEVHLWRRTERLEGRIKVLEWYTMNALGLAVLLLHQDRRDER